MKKNLLFVLSGIVFTFLLSACDDKNSNDLDENLAFSKLSVEEQKQKIEQNGIDMANAMDGMSDTKAMQAIMHFNMLNEEDDVYYSNSISYFAKSVSKKPEFALQKAIKKSLSDDESEWGEFTYDFSTGEFKKTANYTNKIVYKFPADSLSTTNNAVFTLNYTESDVLMPDSETYFPASIVCSLAINGKAVLSGSFTASYKNDYTPTSVKETLIIDNYSILSSISNDTKKLTQSFEIKKDNKTIIKNESELQGKLTIDDAQNNPNESLESFVVSMQLMNIAIKGGSTKLSDLISEINSIDDETLSDQQYMEQEAAILNKYMVCYAYFTDDKTKFADVEFYVIENETTEPVFNWETYEYTYETVMEYELAPRLVLSDGSKMSIEEYFETGFDDLADEIEDLLNSLKTEISSN